MHNMLKRAKGVLLCSIIAAVSLSLSGCSAGNGQDNMVVVDQENNAIAFEFGLVEKGTVQKTEKLACTYRQTNEQEVSFSMSGKLIDKVYVKEGDLVTKGTLLAELSSEELERGIEDLNYAIARNEILLKSADENENYDISGQWVNFIYFSGGSSDDEKNMKENIERIKKNYRYQREDYNDALNLDRQKLANMQKDLRSSRIYAEMDGIVYKLQNHLEGATSKKDDVIMHIVNTSECIFETKAPDQAKLFSPDDLIEMSIVYGAGAGTYTVKPWHMDEWGDTQFFEVVDGPDSSAIEMGTSGSMKVVADKRDDVLSVPLDALHTADGKAFVYILNADGMREVKWVESGLVGDNSVEIKSGLAEGEKVIRK